MPDFEIEVGFNTDELKQATSGAGTGGGAGAGGGLAGAVGTGFKGALVGLGIVGLLSNLKSVMDLVGFLLGIISTAISLLLNMFIQFIVPFFKDPAKAFIGLFVDVVNGILTGIEFLTNAIITGLNFIPGVNIDQVDLPRFQKDVILEAYDGLQDTLLEVAKGNAGIDEVVAAQANYNQSWLDALLTEEEFKVAKELSQASGLSLQESAVAVEELGVNVENFMFEASTGTIKVADTSFNEMERALKYMEDRARELQNKSRADRSNDNGSSTFSSAITTALDLATRGSPARGVLELFNRNFGFRE